ncbi:MAG: hypothetical protein HC858_12900 [Brachymonas sp.]|nr:hypothetical protein [Brachymonas sp.]
MTLAQRDPNSSTADSQAGSQGFGRTLAHQLAKRLRFSERAMHEFPPGTLLQKSGDRLERIAYVMRGQLDVVVHVPGSIGGN